MRWLIASPPTQRRLGAGTISARNLRCYVIRSGGEQFGIVYEKHKRQHPPRESEALFARWWATVTDRAYVQPSTFQFAQAWVRAAHARKGNGQRDRQASQRERMPYSELARFFDNFHMPLLPPEIDEEFLLKSVGLR